MYPLKNRGVKYVASFPFFSKIRAHRAKALRACNLRLFIMLRPAVVVVEETF